MHYYLQFMLVLLRTSSERCAAVICRASEWLADDEQKENHNQYTYCYWLLAYRLTAYGDGGTLLAFVMSAFLRCESG